MAIYHFSGQVIGRSAGRSSIAAAAYRSGEKLLDERTNLVHDFTKKSHDVFYKEIIAPDNAPAWVTDRATLWNTIEKCEKRKDAQLAREFNIALPRELTDKQNIELAREFVKKNFTDKGMIADMCLHHGKDKEGEKQPHIHLMVTFREITENGFGKKVREWNAKNLLADWRKEWAKEANFHLALNGHDLHIDHRRLDEQGINLEPQSKIGTKAAYDAMARYAEHQKIAQENGERIFNTPEIALHAITTQQSTFTHHDIAKFVNRHTTTTEQFNRVYARIKASPELVRLGKDECNRERYTTQEMLKLESNMVTQALEKAGKSTFAISPVIQEHALKSRTLTQEQKNAFDHITGKNDLSCVIGYAGTGKSYMLGAAREAWETAGYNVQGMTLSGRAAENLQISSGIKSHTIANRLTNWEHDRARLTHKDVIVIDEAGMVGSKDLAKIVREAHTARAKVVLIGDPNQLQAIQAGAAFRAISEHTGCVVQMSDIRRQREDWQKEATKLLANGQIATALLRYEEKGHVHSFNTKSAAMDGIISQWEETRSNQPNETLLMLAYKRADVRELNERAREVRKLSNELGEGRELQTERGKREFAENDRVYFLKRDRDLNVQNGTLGTISKIDERGNITVSLDREDGQAKSVRFNIAEYNSIEHGYASTVHKSQGATVDRTYVLASKHFDNSITYPAMSRHRESVDIYWSRDEFSSFAQTARTLGRDNQKDVTLDYTDYAKVRGIELPEKTREPQEINREQFQAAEKSLAERQVRENFGAEVKEFEKDTGRAVNFDLEEGDRGIYRGSVKFGDERYGILEHEQKDEVQLVKYEHCENLERGHTAVIEKSQDKEGQEIFKAVQPREISRERELCLELER